jgi:hypothetical protein
MALGGARSFDLEFAPWRKMVWPRLVHSFSQLTHLRVSPDADYDGIPMKEFEWSVVLSSLVSLDLRICCRRETTVPFGLMTVFSSLNSLKLRWTGVYCGKFGVAADWKRYLPNLRVLDVDHWLHRFACSHNL